jgi:hypothetical protein
MKKQDTIPNPIDIKKVTEVYFEQLCANAL